MVEIQRKKITETGEVEKYLQKLGLAKSMPNKEITTTFLTEAFTVYMKEYQNVTCEETYLYPGVLDTLNKLQAKGYKMVICTNKPFNFIAPILEKIAAKDRNQKPCCIHVGTDAHFDNDTILS